MKSLLYLFVCTIGLSSFAQDSTVQLNFNNVNATICNTGQYFHNNQNLSAGYEIPQGTGLNVMYNAQFWYAAETVGGDILMCLGGNGSASDVDRGPYSSNNSYADPSYDKAYMIKLCQDEIDHFKLWWECNN